MLVMKIKYNFATDKHRKHKVLGYMSSIDIIKCGIVSAVSAILTFLDPIVNNLSAMLVLFTTNVVFGILSDVVNGGRWDKRKMADAGVAAFLFFALVCVIYIIGTLIDNMEGSLHCVVFICYVLLWYYGTNIVRNMKNIVRHDTLAYCALAFIYDVLSLEMVKHIPFLQSYLARTNKNINTDENIS